MLDRVAERLVLSRRATMILVGVVSALILYVIVSVVGGLLLGPSAAEKRDRQTCYEASVRVYNATGGGLIGQKAQQEQYNSCMAAFGH